MLIIEDLIWKCFEDVEVFVILLFVDLKVELYLIT